VCRIKSSYLITVPRHEPEVTSPSLFKPCLRSAGLGPVNLAAALRHHARDPARSLATSASPSDDTETS
jgi:hypothetical protein